MNLHLTKSMILPVIAIFLLAPGCDSTNVKDDPECEQIVAESPVGHVNAVLSFSSGDRPEGIAVDCEGGLYVGVRNGATSRIDRIAPDGQRSTYAVLPDQAAGANGVLGLVVNREGVLYAAHAAGNDQSGIYRITIGSVMRVPGSDGMVVPNAVALTADGHLYATDSYGPSSVFAPGGGCTETTQCGAIWKMGDDGKMRLWLRHSLFDTFENPGAPIPVPGPNGIAFYPPSTLFVANTSGAMVVAVDIADDGTAGSVRMHSQSLQHLATVDGIAVDVSGTIYGVMAAANAEEIGSPPVPAVAKILPDGTTEALVADVSMFDAPTSLTFGSGPRARSCLYIVNAALFGPATNGPGAGVVEVNTGVFGYLFE